jgi:membrane-bound lytic murein transglycosylase A
MSIFKPSRIKSVQIKSLRLFGLGMLILSSNVPQDALSDQAIAGQTPAPPGASVTKLDFKTLKGWSSADHDKVFAVFRRSCSAPVALRDSAMPPLQLAVICKAALAADAKAAGFSARQFFETHFTPWQIQPLADASSSKSATGFMTGYFEPEFPGALTRSADYPTPLYARPADLVTRPSNAPFGPLWEKFDSSLQAARLTSSASGQLLEPFADRAAIEAGVLDGQNLEILWLRDPVDRFVMQVQGSARIRLANGQDGQGGQVRRVAYAGRNGHPYTSLGKILVEEEGIPPAQMTMDKLVARLKSDAGAAAKLMQRNRSFVFFRLADELAADLGPIGGQGVPLTDHHSVAADRTIWPYGLPVMLDGVLPVGGGLEEKFERFAIIQDTGSAIIGPARIDLYFGSGPEAGHSAGLVRHPVNLVVFWPRAAGQGGN